MRWDPVQYAHFSDQRSRAFFDLTARVDVEARTVGAGHVDGERTVGDPPLAVVDLGCGSGELTVTLAQRWPGAVVRGIDSSPEMIAKATDPGLAVSRVQFTVGDARDFDATGTDVLISNAMLQWVPGHDELLVHWSRQLNPGGTLAFQVPANFDAPSHVLMHELAGSDRWHDRLAGVLRGADSVAEPSGYLDLLARAGLAVDVWQTEYLHVLPGPDPVLDWVRGTGLRPVLAALTEPDAAAYTAEYAAALRRAYPAEPYGTVFGFTRTFVVSRKP